MSKGWICVHRSIQDNDIWDDDEPFDRRSAWIDLLLLANHKDKNIIFNGHPLTVKRGTFITSVRKLSEKWKWSNDRTLRYLRLLEQLNMITRDSNNSRTLISIVKYDFFQDMPNSDKDSDKYTDRTLTSHKQQCNNDNNDKQGGVSSNLIQLPRANDTPPTFQEVEEYCLNNGIKIDLEKFYAYYETIHWTKGGVKVNWKAAVDYWHRTDRNSKPQKSSFSDFKQKKLDKELDEMERLFRKEVNGT